METHADYPDTVLQPSLHSLEELNQILLDEAQSRNLLTDFGLADYKKEPEDIQWDYNEIIDAIESSDYPIIVHEDTILIYPKLTLELD